MTAWQTSSTCATAVKFACSKQHGIRPIRNLTNNIDAQHIARVLAQQRLGYEVWI